MKNIENRQKKYSSFKKFLKSPVIKPDSRIIEYSGLGVQLAATILVFLFIGIWIDKKLETKFIFTLLMTFLGFVGGFYKFYATLKELDAKSKKAEKKQK
ncbi:MAG: AtpZ/AtpI family protein [Ignavibacteriae bacterium]|nr:AtpZ/AtpI family protein [Ignavibacteriota bacterium]